MSSLTPIVIADPYNAFNFHNITYEVGQWVDVKDTIDQWLEAHIVNIRPNQICVHYNGWGNQWDEWIDNTSPRVAIFRTHTLQYPASRYLCPTPNIVPDADPNEIPQYNPNLTEMMTKSIVIMDKLKNLMNRFIKMEENKQPDISKEQQLAAQLAPLLDRTGRIISEFAPHLIHTDRKSVV